MVGTEFCARYSALRRPGVRGGGGAMSRFLSHELSRSEYGVFLLLLLLLRFRIVSPSRKSPSFLRSSKGLFALMSSSNSTSMSASPSSSISREVFCLSDCCPSGCWAGDTKPSRGFDGLTRCPPRAGGKVCIRNKEQIIMC